MDLRNPKWMYLKAGLFVLVVLCCFILVWVEPPTVKTALLLLLMIWASARAYYFAFYVIEKYVETALDGEFDQFDQRFHECQESIEAHLERFLDAHYSEFIRLV